MVFPIGHIHAPSIVQRNIAGVIKLAITLAELTKTKQKVWLVFRHIINFHILAYGINHI